jgi:hypothetical protein
MKMWDKNKNKPKDEAKTKEQRLEDSLERMESMEQIDDSQLPKSVLEKHKQEKDENCR